MKRFLVLPLAASRAARKLYLLSITTSAHPHPAYESPPFPSNMKQSRRAELFGSSTRHHYELSLPISVIFVPTSQKNGIVGSGSSHSWKSPVPQRRQDVVGMVSMAGDGGQLGTNSA